MCEHIGTGSYDSKIWLTRIYALVRQEKDIRYSSASAGSVVGASKLTATGFLAAVKGFVGECPTKMIR